MAATVHRRALQRHLVVGDRKPDIRQYTDYKDLPSGVKATVDKVAGSASKFKELPEWISQWQTWLRMLNANDETTLTETAERAASWTREKPWEASKYSGKQYKVYGLGKHGVLPSGAYAFRGLGVPIQDVLNDAVWTASPTATSSLKTPEQQQFAAFLDTHRYGPKPPRADTDKPHTARQAVPDVGKACKGGLIFHTKTRTEKIEIFFDLSGLDLYKVVSAPSGGRKTGPGAITGQELRSLYRQYLKWIENQDVSEVDFNRIHFTFLGHEVEPPWIADPSPWSLYEPRFRKSKEPPSQSEAAYEEYMSERRAAADATGGEF